MKFLDVVVFLLCLNVAISLINATGVFASTAQVQPQDTWMSKFSDSDLEDSSYLQTELSSSQGSLGDIAFSLFHFVSNFFLGVVALPYLFNQFGIPYFLGTLISIPLYAMYMIGIVQFIRGFSLETAQ